MEDGLGEFDEAKVRWIRFGGLETATVLTARGR